MRDNHEGMPELLKAYERDGQFFGAVAVTLGSECRQLEFGLAPSDYRALRRIFQSRPFEDYPGAQYRYYVAHAVSGGSGNHVELHIRVELGRTGRQFSFEIPKSLAANLLWFAEVRDFAAATHLQELQP
jgi:hypothetical protein